MTTNIQVDHPSHYQRPSELTRHILLELLPEPMLELECYLANEKMNHGHHISSAVEYLWRAGEKEGVPAAKDLEKARWWLVRLQEQKKLMGQSRSVAKAIRMIDELLETL